MANDVPPFGLSGDRNFQPYFAKHRRKFLPAQKPLGKIFNYQEGLVRKQGGKRFAGAFAACVRFTAKQLRSKFRT